MKKATRGIWRTMSWSLATAGSLGLAGAAQAQSPYTPLSKPAQVLNREIKSALARALPVCMEQERITVSVWMGGQVVLTGTVATLEDKLAASRYLQRVGGCSCVVNQLKAETSIDKLAASKAAGDAIKRAAGGSATPQASATAEQVKLLPPRAIQVDAQQPVPFLNTPEHSPAHEADAQKAMQSAAKPNPPLTQAV